MRAFLGRTLEDDILCGGFGGGIRAEAGETHGDGRLESGVAQCIADAAGPAFERRIHMAQARGVEPEDAGFARRGFDARAERPKPPADEGNRFVAFGRGDHAAAEGPRERQSGGVAHAGEDPARAGGFVGPLNKPLGLVAIDDHDRPAGPGGMLPQQYLQRKRPDINTSHPVHGRSPFVPRRGPGACL